MALTNKKQMILFFNGGTNMGFKIMRVAPVWQTGYQSPGHKHEEETFKQYLERVKKTAEAAKKRLQEETIESSSNKIDRKI